MEKNGYIWLVDYGLGNLQSVSRAVEKAGGRVRTGADPALLDRARAVILPGVGAFDAAVSNLEAAGLFQPLRHWLESGNPFLGICLGFQLLFESSREGRRRGFGFFPGETVRFPDTVKVPQIGWNSVTLSPGDNPLFEGIADESFFYFVHSYYGISPCQAASAEYGVRFSAALRKGNLAATQFHPEKSGPMGIRLLRNFIVNFCA